MTIWLTRYLTTFAKGWVAKNAFDKGPRILAFGIVAGAVVVKQGNIKVAAAVFRKAFSDDTTSGAQLSVQPNR